MDDLSIARALHVLAVVHWIGGVSMVTLVILPGLNSMPVAARLDVFETIEGPFAWQARLSTLIAGLSGAYLTHRLAAWGRFADLAFWWMHLMVIVWAFFTLVLFVAEPLVLHRWFRQRAARDPEGTLRLVFRLHLILLTVTAAAVAAGVLGAHGAFY
jgi:uncharacterized membrane protein